MISLEKVFRDYPPGFDLDGVLAETATPVLEVFNNDWGTVLGLADITHWSCLADRLVAEGVDSKRAADYEFGLWSNPEILRRAPLTKGTRILMRALEGWEMRPPVVTSRLPILKETTEFWMEQRLPFLRPALWIRKDDGVALGTEIKVEAVKKEGLGLFFDDSLVNARRLLEETGAYVVLIRYPREEVFRHERLIEVPRPRLGVNLLGVVRATLRSNFWNPKAKVSF